MLHSNQPVAKPCPDQRVVLSKAKGGGAAGYLSYLRQRHVLDPLAARGQLWCRERYVVDTRGLVGIIVVVKKEKIGVGLFEY